ncbi:MAG: transporter substrate-binding domain-containing protein [Bacilli bacterium]|jgi:signal transduction histidine kinase/CheY-like chemotaxis protein|nr:transporter substrate-binding domain-containing protein [Bacilli bacterium]
MKSFIKRLLACFFSLFCFFVLPASRIQANDTAISFTAEEIAFIENHPVIKLAVDPNFVPFEFFDEGEYKGIAADYLAIISEKTGIEFEYSFELTWPEAYDRALSKELDAMAAVGKTAEREEDFLFSEPYYHFKRVLVTKDTNKNISDIDDLNGMTVAVQRNSSHHSYLLEYSNINLSLYDSVLSALTAVATGEEQVFVGNLATTNYLIRTNSITNLRFVAFEAEVQQSIYFATQKDFPELIGIVNKVFYAISDMEKMAISNKWIYLEQEIDYGPLLQVLLVIGALIIVGYGVSIYWIRRLQHEVQKRKLIQVDLEKAKTEADEANQFKSSFVARMSHEIRTPLHAIMGMTYLLKKATPTPTQNMLTNRITQASNNMLNIVNDILDFSKIEAGKVELEKVSFSLDQLLYQVLNIVMIKVVEKKLEIVLDRNPHYPDWYVGDPKRIEQILLNLLNNAVKFTDYGRIMLTIHYIVGEKEPSIQFIIEDTGMGMEEEQMKNLFQPFVQGDTSINRRFGGSGLGLSIVKNLVDLMNGTISVSSKIGEGTKFIIHLPLPVDTEKKVETVQIIQPIILFVQSEQDETRMTAILQAASLPYQTVHSFQEWNRLSPTNTAIIDYTWLEETGWKNISDNWIVIIPMENQELFNKCSQNKIKSIIEKPIIPSYVIQAITESKKMDNKAADKEEQQWSNEEYLILVAEDNLTNQFIIQSILKQIEVKVLMAADGAIALELFKQYKGSIDLILMDLHMPNMNGYEAAQEIKKIDADIDIMAMTADIISGVKEHCEQCGIHYYISKPYNPDQLLSLVKEILVKKKKKHLLDVPTGLKNLGANPSLYNQVLQLYYTENQAFLEQLEPLINNKDYQAAAKSVHKLKSSTGSIGAKAVYEQLVLLQQQLQAEQEEDIMQSLAIFKTSFKQLIEEIKKNLYLDSIR